MIKPTDILPRWIWAPIVWLLYVPILVAYGVLNGCTAAMDWIAEDL